MQPLFFVSHSAALGAHEFGISDNIAKFIKFCGYVFFFPFTKLFCLFCHIFLLCCDSASRCTKCDIIQFTIYVNYEKYGCKRKISLFFSLEKIKIRRLAFTILYMDF